MQVSKTFVPSSNLGTRANALLVELVDTLDLGSSLRVRVRVSQRVQNGDVAQLVEQRTENPCVGGSIPSITTKNPVSSQERGFFMDSKSCLPKYQSCTYALRYIPKG